MFTGLVQGVGEVVAVVPSPAAPSLTPHPTQPPGPIALHILPGPITAPGWPPAPGDSISVAGVCLTVAEPPGPAGVLRFDVVPQTLALTRLGTLRPGDRVNLEACVTPSTLLGGHLVQGHVDGLGVVARVTTGADWRVRVALPPRLHAFMTPQGSIALDGVSLTIAALSDSAPSAPAHEPADPWIEVALIPTTLAKTTLGSLKPGDRVHVEADHIAKLVATMLAAQLARRT